MELDHFFICVDLDGPEAEALLDFGLEEGSRNRHPGQGTANRRFFFHNVMLELLWMTDPSALQDEPAARTRLCDRFFNAGHSASPFGVCFRPSGPEETRAPFSCWDYRAPHLPRSAAIQIGEDTPLAEPMWFFIGNGMRPDRYAEIPQPLEHRTGFHEVTLARIRARAAEPFSRPAQAAIASGWVTMRPSEAAVLELEFDHCKHYEWHDFRPQLPLIFRW